MSLQGQQTRSALGRVALIGELCNIRDESLSSRSLFNSDLPKSTFETVDIANTKFYFNFTENISDKFDLLKIETELQLSVLLKLFEVKGSGEFLAEEKKSENIISCALMCQIRTVQDKFFASFEELLPYVDIAALRNSEYTHFVSETTWGANCLLSLEVACKDELKKKEIKGALKAYLSKFKILANVQSGAELGKNWSKFCSSGDVNIKVHADLVPEDTWPTSVEGFFEFLSKVPKLLKNVNGGKGKLLSYTLIPLEDLRKFAQLENSLDLTVWKIDEGFVTSMVLLFEEIGEMKQRLYDLHTELTDNIKYVKSEILKEAGDMKEKLSIQESNLKTLVSENWAKVRSGEKKLKDLLRQVENSKNNDLKLYQYNEYLNSCSPILKKLSLVKLYTSKNIIYLGKDETFTNLQLNYPSHEFIVFVTSSEFEENNAELCRNTAVFFISQTKQNTIYVVVDLDLTDGTSFLDERVFEARCFHVKGNKVLSTDLFAVHQEESESNFARRRTGSKLEVSKHKPGNRVHLEISCPGSKSGTCPTTSHIWLCYVCRENIEFGFDGNFYCTCGKFPTNSLEYRCKDPKHGNDFVIAEEEFLKNALLSLRPLKEMNIVVLGQTGVGKSTWINSIVNYLTYDTMSTAQENGVICTIPFKYAFYDPLTFKQQEIKLGKKREEVDVGMSDTQEAHTYNFLWEGRCVRIIDTPGIADTRGIQRDKENMKSIMEHLGYLRELHGLCILLKASDNRDTKLFSYSIKELMVYLPRSVIKNIVFCFTNSRGALYTSGQSSVILSNLIKKLGLETELSLSNYNTFVLDNEGFIFLCSLSCSNLKAPVEVRNSYEKSWQTAKEETYRLFNTITTFEPCFLKEIIDLVDIRERVFTLTRPLAEVGKNIQMNLAKLEKQEEKIKESSLSVQELQEKLFISETFLEMETLPYPRTVCTAASCVKILEFNSVKQTEYHTICHDRCYVKEVEPQTVNNCNLKYCDVMFAGSCTICNCGWEEHMHLTYSQKRTEKAVKNTTVEKKIERKEEEIKTIQNFIETLKKKTEDYKKEQDLIVQTLAKFGMFLKQNAITVHNNSVEAYLQHLIQEQIKIPDKTDVDEKILEGLKNTLEQYKEEEAVLKKVIQAPMETEKPSIEEISKLEDSLYELPLTGAQIRQCVQVSRMSTARVKEYRETPILVNKKHTKKKGFVGSVKSILGSIF